MVKVTVPATSANVGAGFDALGLAVSMHNTVTLEECGRIDILASDGTLIPTGPGNLVYRSAKAVFDQLGQPLKGIRIRQENPIPMARGLGSSSACIVAGILGANGIVGAGIPIATGSAYAAKLLGLTFSKDERLVCIAENDACGVDAVQALLGCSVGKGNLLFHMTGKQAFSFYERTSGKSVRLVLRPAPSGMTREESFRYYQAHTAEELFDVKETKLAVPEHARLFESYVCDVCGETAGANWVRIRGGKTLCLDCAGEYDRFHV